MTDSTRVSAAPLPNVPHVVTLSGARVVLWDSLKRRPERLAHEHMDALVSLLVIGTARQRDDVAGILANAACDRANRKHIAAVGGVPLLVQLAKTACSVKVARAMFNMAWHNEENQKQIFQCGGVDALVEVLIACDSESTENKSELAEEATRAIGLLVENAQIATRVDTEPSGHRLNELAQNGNAHASWLMARIACHTIREEQAADLADIPALVAMLTNENDASRRTLVVELLRRLSHDADNKAKIVVAGALEPLIALLETGSEKQRVDAAWTLGQLAWNAFSESQIANAGAIPPLLGLLRSRNVREREGAVWALRHLSCTSDNRTRIGSTPHAVASIVECVRSAESACEREHAIATLKNLACHSDNQTIIADAGAIQLLVTVLTKGSQRQVIEAAATLRNLVRHNTRNQSKLRTAGGIRPLVALISKSGSETQQLHAAAALANIACTTEAQSEIVAEGALAPLLSLTQSTKTITVLEQAVLLMRNLTWKNELIQKRIASSGIIPRIAAMLQSKSSDVLKRQAAAVLRNLAWMSPANQKLIVEARALPLLASIVATGTSGQREEAAGAIANLVWNNLAVQDQVTKLHGLGPLVDLMGHSNEKLQKQATLALQSFVFGENKKVRPTTPRILTAMVQMLLSAASPAQRHQATWAIANLACNNENKSGIVGAGGLNPLVSLLKDGSNSQKQYAASAIANLAWNQETKIKIIDAGAIPPLVELVTRGSDGQKKQAAWALRNLAWNCVEGQTDAGSGGAIPPLVLLVENGTDIQKEHAAAALANLACLDANQPRINAAGGVTAMINLMEYGTDNQKQQAVWALANLAVSPANRGMIVDEGGLLGLQTLADTGTPEQKRGASAALSRIHELDRHAFSSSQPHAVFRVTSDISDDVERTQRSSGSSRTSGISDSRASKANKSSRTLHRAATSIPDMIIRSPSSADASSSDRSSNHRQTDQAHSSHQSPDHHHKMQHLPSLPENGSTGSQHYNDTEWASREGTHAPPDMIALRRIQSEQPQVRVAHRMPPSPVEQSRLNRPLLPRPSTLGDLLDPYGGAYVPPEPAARRPVTRIKSDLDVIREAKTKNSIRIEADKENTRTNPQYNSLRVVTDFQDSRPLRRSMDSQGSGGRDRDMERRSIGSPSSGGRSSYDRQVPRSSGDKSDFTHLGPSTLARDSFEEVYEFDEDDLHPFQPSFTSKSKYPEITL